MAAMHTVEHPDGEHAPAPVCGDLILPPPPLHNRKPKLLAVSPWEQSDGLTTVAQDYLKVIWTAQEWSPDKVSTKMLAEKIGVSASTASESIRKLADAGLVDHEKYGAVSLTEDGRRAALAMVRRHRLIETFLVCELGYGWDEVHDEAEVLEHAVSDQLIARIDAKLGFPQRDPHGDPIPADDGQVPTPPARQLWACTDGESGTVARISDHDPEMLRYFAQVGISLDARLRVLTRREFAGIISVALESPGAPAGEQTTIDLGSPAAQAIWVV